MFTYERESLTALAPSMNLVGEREKLKSSGFLSPSESVVAQPVAQ